MALPKQIEQQLAEVAEIEKALAEPAVSAVQTEEVPNVVPQEVVPVDAAPTEPVVPKADDVEPKPSVPEETWEQKYQTLKGMFDSQVPPLHAKVRELTQNLQGALGELETLKTVKPTPVEPARSSVTPEDEEVFGKDLIALQRRIASEAVTPLQTQISALENENTTLRELLGRTGTEVATLTFEQRLSAAVPDFDQVNTDPAWIAWLDEIDPMALDLEPRRIKAEAAYRAGDVARVAHCVELFKRTRAPVSAAPTLQRQSELQSQVAPPRTQAAAAPVSQAQKMYTEADASRLYDTVASLNRAGKYEEAAKLDAELTAAYSSGRVR